MKQMILCVLGVLASWSPVVHAMQPDASSREFVKSFIDHYTFDIPGRYTREYHPYLLEKTAHGFSELELRLGQEGLHIDGRVIIAGYEAQAMPSYYTNFGASKIDDEASRKTSRGWSLQLHNQFGFMTGFLLKNANFFGGEEKVFEHICPETIELFRDRSGVFQQHAFGESYPILTEYQEYVDRAFTRLAMDPGAVLRVLTHFWLGLYEQQVAARRDMIAGTQDVLFSVAYARHLLASSVRCEKYYTGADITYPIETFIGQTRSATHVAQQFVQKFVPTMTRRHDENTVYIFCSFVDGVGKSTMLGNVWNWQRFGDDIEKYERVDNSSSQFATMYQLRDGVYIADLPAQISHFTYKPDGLVYVPVETELSPEEYRVLADYVRGNAKTIFKEAQATLKRTQEIFEVHGALAPELNDPKNPAATYLRNLILLGRQEVAWIPFDRDGKHYLVHQGTGALRMLCPLGNAPSQGLKNIDSEQMLWYEGVRFPVGYHLFLADLMRKLKDRAITQVVFVDFLSMYPRSQRENIRLNYLLQQLALLENTFVVHRSLYKDFVGPSELLSDLNRPSMRQALFEGFVSEVLVRLALFRIYDRYAESQSVGVPLGEVSTILAAECEAIRSSDLMAFITQSAEEKFKLEYKHLEHQHGRSKDYLNVQELSLPHVVAFSNQLCALMPMVSGVERMRLLWSLSDESIVSRFTCDLRCKDVASLSQFIPLVRTSWYAALANLLESTTSDSGQPCIVAERYAVPPVLALSDGESLHIVQRQLEQGEPDARSIGSIWDIAKKSAWGSFDGVSYLLNWIAKDSSKRVYAFGYTKKGKGTIDRFLPVRSEVAGLDAIVAEYQEKRGVNAVMPTSSLYRTLHASDEWQQWYAKKRQEASQKGAYPLRQDGEKFEGQPSASSLLSESRGNTYAARPDQYAGIRLFVQAIATLEMILRDPEASIAVRFGNRDDFKAALWLVENVVLPACFGILCPEPLFEDYSAVEPLIGWKAFAT